MNIIFKKSQLKLVEDITNNSDKPALSQTNSEMDGNSDSAVKDYNEVQQNNTNGLPINVNTQSYMSTPIKPENAAKTLTIKKDASAGSEISRTLASTNPVDMPGTIRVENKKKNKVVEGITFSKKELDKFLKTL